MICVKIYRCLKADGVFVSISYGDPDSRLSLLRAHDLKWAVNVHPIRMIFCEGDCNNIQ